VIEDAPAWRSGSYRKDNIAMTIKKMK